MSKPSSLRNINRRRRRKKIYARLQKAMQSASLHDKKQVEAKLLKVAPWRSLKELGK